MLIKTQNSTYQLTGLGSKFEIRKVREGGSDQPIVGEKFFLEVGQPFQLFSGGKLLLTTSLVHSVMG